MLRKLFWKIVKKVAMGAMSAYFDKKIDGDKPKEPEKQIIGPREPFIDPGTGSRLGRGKKQPIDKRGK